MTRLIAPENLFLPLLILHITGGAIGLITGSVNLVRRKGDRLHRLAGKWFMYAMLASSITALALSVLHPNAFLFIIGLFTLYMICTGYRYLKLRNMILDQRPMTIDWIFTGGMLVAGLIFIFLGVQQLIHGRTFGIVYAVFGGVGLFFVKTDFTCYRGKSRFKNYWLLVHLQRMTGSYIAATTAFLVVNAKYFPELIPGAVFWLLPTVVLTPLIIAWSRKQAVRI